MQFPNYLNPTLDDYRTSVVIQPGDDPEDAAVVLMAHLKRYIINEEERIVDAKVLRAIVHDWLLISGTIRLPGHDGESGIAIPPGEDGLT